MAICGCGLPAHCCQPAVAGGIIYADLRGELSTDLALQALFTQSSLVRELLLQAFPFPSTLGEVILNLLSLACMFIYSSHGKWVFSPFPSGFPPTTTFTSFPAPDCWACAAAPAGRCVCLQLTWEGGLPPSPVEFSSLCHSHKLSHSWLLGTCSYWLVYLQFWEGFPSPSLQSSGCTTLFAMCLYCSYCLLFSFSVCPGGYADLAQGCLWKYHVPRSSPCLCLPKPSGCGRLMAREPSWFLHLT
jgi:hypothetical protein